MTQLQTNPMLSAQDRFARNVTARLTEGSAALPHDISERLRIARMQALAHRKQVIMRSATVVASQGGGTAALTFGNQGDNDRPNWWTRFAAALPLVALVAGLLTIYVVQNDLRADELAEVDTALLTDDLPTVAYTDPGFVEFLKANRDTTSP
ncbi:DUF3619 family protein [Rhodoferax sp.]|uniref:DUF3619 family protein n=1 Tax=Rhodoferax sp. TaxID=50421 RepID=UPI0025D7EDAD|nr:DUF3619 family protein [Rhodoferax sp.]